MKPSVVFSFEMASSSVSQEDVENDFELSSRRSRIRTARARTVNPPTRLDPGGGDLDDIGSSEVKTSESLSFPAEHDASPKPLSRAKEKRVNRCVTVRQPLTEHVSRTNHMNKGKQQQRDRRKLREKRRSTGVVHLPSTEERVSHKTYPSQRRNKSPSDLEADDEDNQEFDSLNQSDSTVSSLVHPTEPPCRPRPGTPTGDNPEELLERAQEENRRLLSLLEDRDHKIATLEARILQLQREMAMEKERLREENATVRAMTSLTTTNNNTK
ncbi:PRKC apoptosis WT1 regulator protein isoform X4 [Anabrus simplex]|uniref:PRKC apoptosis WT1 regulator protein isoform X4 n=1 Tax=Anabrus simplex TaxID=316456 RepID=UPI0034DD7259